MGWLSDIVGTVGSVVGSSGIPFLSGLGNGLSNWANKRDAKDQLASEQAWNANQAELNRQFQRDERLETQQFNIDMWNMNNEYNSPVERMKRAQAAGINPNLVIGELGGGSSQPVQSSPMSGSQASFGGSLASTMLTSDAIVANLLSQADLNDAKRDREQYGLEWDKMTAPVLKELYEAQRDEVKKNIEKMTRDIEHINFDEGMQDKMFELYSSKNQAEINVMTKQLQEIGARIRNLDAQTSLAEAQEVNVDAQTAGLDYDNIVKKARAQIAEITGFPPDTPANYIMYTLAKEGRIQDLSYIFTVEMLSQNGGGLFGTVRQGANAIGGFLGSWFGSNGSAVGRDNMNLLNPDGSEAGRRRRHHKNREDDDNETIIEI